MSREKRSNMHHAVVQRWMNSTIPFGLGLVVLGGASARCTDGAEPATPGPVASVTSGLLTPPSTDTPTSVARNYLHAQATGPLNLTAQDNLVRATQPWHGLRVIGGDAAVRVDDDGQVRWARTRLVDLPGTLTPEPTITAEEAVAAARRTTAVPEPTPAATELVVFAPPHVPPRLAWQVQFAPHGPQARTMRAFVAADAPRPGQVLQAHNMTLRDRRAWVYDENPKVSTKEEVTLSSLQPGATVLKDADFDVRACVDDLKCTEFERTSGDSFGSTCAASNPPR